MADSTTTTTQFHLVEDFLCFEAQGVAPTSWMVANGPHNDATIGNVADDMIGNLAAGRYQVHLTIEVTRIGDLPS
jgi:hypothetical protein